MSKRRTKQEIRVITKLAGSMPVAEIADILGRSINFVAVVAAEEGLSLGYYRNNCKWKTSELKAIRAAIIEGKRRCEMPALIPEHSPASVVTMYYAIKREMVSQGVLHIGPRGNVVAADQVV